MPSPSIIRFADARDESAYGSQPVHLVITSPPYWSIKDYGAQAQIGTGQDYDEYIADLDRVWAHCMNALLPGCKMCINVGDQFLRAKEHGRYRVLPIRTRIIESMMNLGADYMGAIIWQKMTNTNTSGGGTLMGSYPHPRNGILKIDYEFILVFKKPGKAPRPTPEQKAESAMAIEEWSRNFTAHWNFGGERMGKHHAMFPLELPRRLIRMFSFPGETVFDPFAGAGTTIRAAIEQGRCGMGIELHHEFREAMEQRLGPTLDHVQFESEQPIATPSQPSTPFYGSAHRVEQVGQPRWSGTGKVQQVDGPLTLSIDGTRWQLEGLLPGPDPDACETALRELVDGKMVVVEPTEGSHAYVRLKNRTLINARLSHMGHANPDPQRSHRNRARFIRYAVERDATLPC